MVDFINLTMTSPVKPMTRCVDYWLVDPMVGSLMATMLELECVLDTNIYLTYGDTVKNDPNFKYSYGDTSYKIYF